MLRIFKKLSRELAPDPSLEMSIRLFQLICLTVSVLTLFAILPVNLFQNLPILVNIGDVLLGLFAFFCFRESTRGRHHKSLFLIFMLLLMEPIWFLNAGTDGSITLYFMVVLIYPMVMFRGVKRWAMTSCIAFNICVLLAIDYFFPSLAVPFRSPIDRALDLISGAFCSCLGLVIIVWVVISNYDKERERTEKYARDLAEMHHRLETTVAAIPDLMFELDAGAHICEYHAPAAELLYAPPEVFLGKTVDQVLPPDAAAVILNALARAASAGIDRGASYALDMHGSRCWYELSIAKKHDSSPPDTRFVALVRNITERKQAEETLRESWEMLRSIFISSPDSITVVDLNERIKLCNQSTADIHGYSSAEQLIGKSLSELVAEEDRPRMMEAKKHVMIHGFAKDIPFIGLRGSGGQFAGELSFSVLKDSSGRPTGFVGVTRDTTERKRAEKALRQSEERFRQVVETVSDFIWEVDVDGLYTFTSPSVEKILGYTANELVGKLHFYDLFVPEVREQLKTAALEAFKARQSFRAFPNRNLSKNGRTVYLETNGVPIVDEAGHLLGYRGTDTDVTDRHQAEMETQILRQELARFSRIATVGQLTTSIAHELNQPLAAILSNAQAALRLMRGGTPDLKELHEIFDDIVDDDKRAGEIIRRMRSMLKRDTGEHSPISMNSLITNVVAIVQNDTLINEVSVVLDLGSPLPPVDANQIQLQQAILNLVVNALEAVEGSEQPQEVVLRTRQADGKIILYVVDAGPGIPADKLESIFEPFYTTKPNGMGLGLSIARTIIEAHEGRIWAENNPSHGASFFIALPASGRENVASHQN